MANSTIKHSDIYHNGKSQTPVDNAWLKSVIREVLDELNEGADFS